MSHNFGLETKTRVDDYDMIGVQRKGHYWTKWLETDLLRVQVVQEHEEDGGVERPL